MTRATLRRLILALSLLCTAAAAAAQTAPHPWLTTPPRLAKYAHFTNLSDGAKIETPFLLKFGLTGYGLAPIVKEQEHTGHHHLLINRELPLDFTRPLPFNDQYIHFGAGQMETVLTLKPGTYTLRLVLADHRHVPNFVYSKPLHVTVTQFHADVPPASLQQAGVSLMLPNPGEPVSGVAQVMFHASKLNVSHVALTQPGTGHFRLHLTPEAGGRTETIDFSGGETEAWLRPPKGRYTLKLDFIDNVDTSKVLYSSAPATLDMAH